MALNLDFRISAATALQIAQREQFAVCVLSNGKRFADASPIPNSEEIHGRNIP
jgi:hypothetical protein